MGLKKRAFGLVKKLADLKAAAETYAAPGGSEDGRVEFPLTDKVLMAPPTGPRTSKNGCKQDAQWIDGGATHRQTPPHRSRGAKKPQPLRTPPASNWRRARWRSYDSNRAGPGRAWKKDRPGDEGD